MAQTLDSQSILAITLFLALPLLFFILKQLKSHNPPLPPGPNQWPILDTIYQFLYPMTHISLANLAQSYGPLMRLKLGTQLLIVGSSPAAALEILKANDRVLSARSVPHSVPLTPSQISKLSFWDDTINDNWKNFRTICRMELFSTKALEFQACLREKKVVEMVEKLRLKEGVATNVEQIVFVTVINMFSNVYFSRDILGLEDEFGYNQMRGLLNGVTIALTAPNLSDFYPFLGKFDLNGLREKYRKISVGMRELWDPIVKERRELDGGDLRPQDFLDSLFSRGFGDDQINQLLEELFSAGLDTTTSTIKRTMIELLTNPESMSKLKQELDSAFNHQDYYSLFTSSHIENLPYLQSCIKETLRLHPPVPTTLSHRAREKCHVMNFTIPENARVMVNIWAIGRDPTAWDEPMKYRPERFLGSTKDFKGNDFEFLPFGAGRRICPGLRMAAKIVPLVVAALLFFFDWSSLHGAIVDENFRATSQMKEPLLLIPRART